MSIVMHQVWDRLLFMHWRFPLAAVRGLLPAGLTLDTFDGAAWVSITPFTMHGIRLRGLPPLPFLDRAHEVNLRTYASRNGEPGVWFFSLDISHAGMASAARASYHLPYYTARIEFTRFTDGTERFLSRRASRSGREALVDVAWEATGAARPAAAGTLEHFLVERYCLYAARGDRLYRARIHHPPWLLRPARVASLRTTLREASGLAAPADDPIVQAQGEALEVGVELPRRIA